jgi:hypothetical protein
MRIATAISCNPIVCIATVISCNPIVYIATAISCNPIVCITTVISCNCTSACPSPHYSDIWLTMDGLEVQRRNASPQSMRWPYLARRNR